MRENLLQDGEKDDDASSPPARAAKRIRVKSPAKLVGFVPPAGPMFRRVIDRTN